MSLFYQDREFTDAQTAYQEIFENVTGSFKSFFIGAKRDIIPILTSWIHSSPGDSPLAWEFRRKNGQSRHMLVFQDYTNMARAVLGEFLAEGNLEDFEIPLAIKTTQSGYIDGQLAALLVKIRQKIEQEGPGSVLRELLNPNSEGKGPYKPLYKDDTITLSAVLTDPTNEKFKFRHKIVTLHDTMDFLKKKSPQLVQVPPGKSLGTYFRITDTGEREFSRQSISNSEDFRFKDKKNVNYTLKESTGYIMCARIKGMPIWAGPSFTTGRLMMMTEWAGATLEQKKAMAWGIFAFWNQCYPHSSTWIHRYHSVMDMAANFGVIYQPFEYAKDITPNDAR